MTASPAGGVGLSALLPGATDRAALVGTTGCGKTHLGALVLRAFPYVLALDGKGTLSPRKAEWQGYRLVQSMAKLAGLSPVKYPRIIYRPPVEEMLEGCEEVLDFVYRRHNTMLYIDELTTFARGIVPPIGLMNCLTRGRELRIGTLIATQRPAQIPQIVLSEAEHVYAFRLQMPQDRLRMADVYGIPEHRLARLRKREFLYKRDDDERTLGPFTLRYRR